MVVYADMLMLVNFIVDYFLLALSAVILRRRVPLWRRLLGASLGAVSSLYIFLPQSPLIFEIAVRLILSGVITLAAFGFKSVKDFLRAAVCFFAVTFLYAGAMMALWFLFRPNGMVINNSVVYFDVSPLFLIAFSVIGYFVSAGVRFLLEKKSTSAKRCTVDFAVGENKLSLDAIVDTGNSLTDVFGLSQVIIAEKSAAASLFGEDLQSEFCRMRYRALPCSTVLGTQILDGYRCDSASVTFDGKCLRLESPILAISKSRLYGCRAIVNPKSLE